MVLIKNNIAKGQNAKSGSAGIIEMSPAAASTFYPEATAAASAAAAARRGRFSFSGGSVERRTASRRSCASTAGGIERRTTAALRCIPSRVALLLCFSAHPKASAAL